MHEHQRVVTQRFGTGFGAHRLGFEEGVVMRWRDDRDEAALHELTEAHMRLVIAVAAKFKRYGLPFSDLIQEGNIGLMKAAERFEPERDVRFSTYVTWWIRSCIQDYVLRNWSIVRTGTTSAQKSLFFNLRRMRARIGDLEGSSISPENREQIARDLRVRESDVDTMVMRLGASDRSLNAPVGDEENSQWQDFLVDENAAPEVEVMESTDSAKRSAWLGQAIEGLNPATGEFVALLDDDDVWLADHIRPHIAHMDANPDCAAVFGQVVFADHKMRRLPDQWRAAMPDDGDVFRMMMSGWFPQVGATVVRGDVARKIGLMDESLIGDSDWDWQMRITRDYPTAIIGAECVLFRGKAPGGSDKLLWMRTKFTRKIFFRHLWANRRRWPSAVSIVRSYFGCMQNYYAYFVESAATKSTLAGRFHALWRAFLLFPTRLVRHALKDTPVRRTLLGRANSAPQP